MSLPLHNPFAEEDNPTAPSSAQFSFYSDPVAGFVSKARSAPAPRAGRGPAQPPPSMGHPGPQGYPADHTQQFPQPPGFQQGGGHDGGMFSGRFSPAHPGPHPGRGGRAPGRHSYSHDPYQAPQAGFPLPEQHSNAPPWPADGSHQQFPQHQPMGGARYGNQPNAPHGRGGRSTHVWTRNAPPGPGRDGQQPYQQPYQQPNKYPRLQQGGQPSTQGRGGGGRRGPSDNISQYFKPSFLSDPWAPLMRQLATPAPAPAERPRNVLGHTANLSIADRLNMAVEGTTQVEDAGVLSSEGIADRPWH